jgi:hypothetical protein
MIIVSASSAIRVAQGKEEFRFASSIGASASRTKASARGEEYSVRFELPRPPARSNSSGQSLPLQTA